jgi:hypothetical protein
MPKEPPKRKPGRPMKYDEPSVNKTHRMTPKGHQWVKEHRDEIELKARSQ